MLEAVLDSLIQKSTVVSEALVNQLTFVVFWLPI